MVLKNYTSEIPVGKSISHIETKLAYNGAKQIVKFYDTKNRVCAIAFVIIMDGLEIPYKLPARVSECEKILKGKIRRPRQDTYKRIEEQAERTVWKIISDWVDAQMALIELSQVEFMEVFMPYLYNHLKKQTYFEAIKERGYKALLPGFIEK